ncbi:Ankyrin repeat protein [Legionella sainthelensi]|uniref:ankyrin repeat domain-containing protein n=1 Tax=Legionella sainthelensi TaxID=28087 RepID=UPI000F6F385F|nr:ankyrin repeat domain-containing protein [Legionella sainthelensi]VEB35392.1 Ankyrin repeat protein [Legionella sainthelensi]
MVQFYISHGVDINTIDASKETALHLAVHMHHDALTPDFSPENKREMLELLLSSGAKSSLNLEDNDGMTPLMIAIVLNDMDTFKWLIKVGADIAFKNTKDQSALDMAKLIRRQDMHDILQSDLSKKSVPSNNSYEILRTKLLEEINLIIEEKIKKIMQQERNEEEKQLLATPMTENKSSQKKRAVYFIESFSDSTKNNSLNSTSSTEFSFN